MNLRNNVQLTEHVGKHQGVKVPESEKTLAKFRGSHEWNYLNNGVRQLRSVAWNVRFMLVHPYVSSAHIIVLR